MPVAAIFNMLKKRKYAGVVGLEFEIDADARRRSAWAKSFAYMRGVLDGQRGGMTAVDRRSFFAPRGGRRSLLAAAAAGCGRPSSTFINTPITGGRSDDALAAHQRAMGVSPHGLAACGLALYGLAAEARGNDSVAALSGRYPQEFVYFANELPDIAENAAGSRKIPEIRGRAGIGEQKFPVECDSRRCSCVYSIARDLRRPGACCTFNMKPTTSVSSGFTRCSRKFPRRDVHRSCADVVGGISTPPTIRPSCIRRLPLRPAASPTACCPTTPTCTAIFRPGRGLNFDVARRRTCAGVPRQTSGPPRLGERLQRLGGKRPGLPLAGKAKPRCGAWRHDDAAVCERFCTTTPRGC